MKARDKNIAVHVPPNPGRWWQFLLASALLSLVVSIATLGPGHANLQPLQFLVSFGSLPGLFLYQVFGFHWYGEGKIPSAGFPDVAVSSRFWVRAPEKGAASEIIETAGAGGTAGETVRLLCLQPPSMTPWVHPMMLFQYMASVINLWFVWTSSYYSGPCLILPVAWLFGFISLFWLMAQNPWRVISILGKQCWVDDATMPKAYSPSSGLIVRAAPDEDGLVVMLDVGEPMKLRFPDGTLSSREQQMIALDLLRLQGIPTTAETPRGAGPYRQEV